MRVLMTTHPMRGHFYPAVPLLWALRSAGHQVTVAATADFTGPVRETGLASAYAGPAVDRAAVWSRDRSGRPVPRLRDTSSAAASTGAAWARCSAPTVRRLVELVDRLRPDLVVTEPVEFAGAVAARARGAVWAQHGWGLPVPDALREAAFGELAPECARWGVTEPGWPDLVFDVCPPALAAVRPASGGELRAGGGRVVRMRYGAYNGGGFLPRWLGGRGRRPLVCLTLGSLLPAMGAGHFLRLMGELTRLIPACGADVVVAVSDELAVGMQPLADGVVGAGWYALDMLLPRCDLVVHHGGAGTTMTAAVHGVPQVVLTQQVPDMAANAAAVEAAGVGLRTGVGVVDSEEVRALCATVLADGGYRERAALVAAEAVAQPAPAQVAAALPAMVAGPGVRV